MGERDRDRTQSLNVDPNDPDPDLENSAMALGTGHREEGTKVDSPIARARPPTAKKPPPVPARGADDAENRLGTTLGNYRVEEVLGKGGMGYVYRAEHTKLGREVAIKLLRADYAKRRDAVARFIQEARTVNRIRHRNIVDVPDIVELEDGTTFIVMEFLRGQSLGKWARSGIDLPRALAVLVQICDGLAAAHAVSVVHRDLKPDNVIVIPTSDGAELVKLLDFGVAKLLNREDEDFGFQTAAGSVIGTPAYMSPEQAGGMAIDARSDQYSLGAIMYELFTGQTMFRGRSFGEYVRKHLTERPTPPRQTQGGSAIDERLEAVIMKCLEKEPAMRYATIVDLRDALLTMLGGLETMPPGFATNSSIRSYPLNPGAATIMPLVPQLVPMLPPIAPQATPGPSPSGVINPSAEFRSYNANASSLPGLPNTGIAQPPGTPWYVWFLGGVIAVGLGVGGALAYAKRGSSPEPVKTEDVAMKPTASPIVEPAKIIPIAVKFDSLPSASVYETGRSAELCKTPCSFDVDPNDGGTKRTFIVRAAGFKDTTVAVDLDDKAHLEFRETLVADQPAVVPEKQQTTSEVVDDPKPDPKKPGGKRPGGKRPGGKPPVETVKEPEVKPEIKEPEVKPEIKPDPKKPDEKIDSSETLDPFKKKKKP